MSHKYNKDETTGGKNCKRICLQVFLNTNRKSPPISVISNIISQIRYKKFMSVSFADLYIPDTISNLRFLLRCVIGGLQRCHVFDLFSR